jgi:hypothetical protein
MEVVKKTPGVYAEPILAADASATDLEKLGHLHLAAAAEVGAVALITSRRIVRAAVMQGDHAASTLQ